MTDKLLKDNNGIIRFGIYILFISLHKKSYFNGKPHFINDRQKSNTRQTGFYLANLSQKYLIKLEDWNSICLSKYLLLFTLLTTTALHCFFLTKPKFFFESSICNETHFAFPGAKVYSKKKFFFLNPNNEKEGETYYASSKRFADAGEAS